MTEPDNKPKKIEEEKSQLSKIDLMHHLLNEGTVAYVTNEIDHETFIEALLDWMQQELKIEALYSKGENIHTVEYNSKGAITSSLGLSTAIITFSHVNVLHYMLFRQVIILFCGHG